MLSIQFDEKKNLLELNFFKISFNLYILNPFDISLTIEQQYFDTLEKIVHVPFIYLYDHLKMEYLRMTRYSDWEK